MSETNSEGLSTGGAESADEGPRRLRASQEDVSQRWERILQELRVTQTGTQILSGFLLSVAFQQRSRNCPGMPG